MTEYLFIAMAAQLILILSGLGLLQIISFRHRIPLWSSLPYAWGLGLLFLYLFGGIFIKFNILPDTWHYVILCITFLVLLVAARIYITTSNDTADTDLHKTKLQIPWYAWFIVILITVKICLVFYNLITNPVIDADAAKPHLWMGLAKLITESGTFSYFDLATDRLLPSLAPVWVRMFLPRWHDSLISLPWFTTYLSIIGVSFVACYDYTKNFMAALFCGYIFSAIPLAAVHVIRPGYADLFVAYFFLCGISIMTLTFNKDRPIKRYTRPWLAVAGLLGCILSKEEGTAWALWMLFSWAGYYMNVKMRYEWRKILSAQLLFVIILFGVYLVGADFIRSHISMSPRVALLFNIRYDPQVIIVFFKNVFKAGSFNLWWWIFFMMAFFLIARKTPVMNKILTIYTVSLFVSILYFSCFTANINFTLQSTNVQRFLLQISGSLLPLFCAVNLRKEQAESPNKPEGKGQF